MVALFGDGLSRAEAGIGRGAFCLGSRCIAGDWGVILR